MAEQSEASEIYHAYVEALTATEAKRQSANQIYLTLGAAIITAYSTLPNFPERIAGALIIFVSAVWVASIVAYRTLSRAKFDVIQAMESTLPHSPFTDEWKAVPVLAKRFGFTGLEIPAPIVMIGFGIYIILHSPK